MPTLELTETELAVVKAALDTFIRTRLGRADTAMEKIIYSGVRHDGRQLTVEETLAARQLLTEASEILTGITHGGPGIFSEKISNDARVAYRVIARLENDKMRESMVGPEGQVLA